VCGCAGRLSGDDAGKDGPASGGKEAGAAADGPARPRPDALPPDRSPDQAPPFSCSLPATAPSLKLSAWRHPAAPAAGQTVTLSLQSKISPKPSKPAALNATLINRQGSRVITAYDVAGGKYWIYHIPVAGLSRGDNCIVVRRGGAGAVEYAVKVKAAPAAGVARGSGPWKVIKNHQWRCDEQPKYGNLLNVRVLDEKGKAVKGARVRIRWGDDTVYPVKPDSKAASWSAHAHPKVLVTGSDGKASLTTPWGKGIRTPIDGKPGYLMFFLDVQGGASDMAMEITTGLWEATGSNCNYCSKYGINVYGHWSYSVEFRRDPKATRVCEVGHDHAGQKKCAYTHLYHDPKRPSCLPVK